MRTVQELENAGVAALIIEDTLLPRPFGEKKPAVISIEEGIGKMRAALAARKDNALTIIGRTSAPSINGLADGIKRLKAYQQTGVDALFIAGGLTRPDLDAIAGKACEQRRGIRAEHVRVHPHARRGHDSARSNPSRFAGHAPFAELFHVVRASRRRQRRQPRIRVRHLCLNRKNRGEGRNAFTDGMLQNAIRNRMPRSIDRITVSSASGRYLIRSGLSFECFARLRRPSGIPATLTLSAKCVWLRTIAYPGGQAKVRPARM